MKTNDLITAIATDAGSSEMPIQRTVWMALAAAVLVPLIVFLLEVGPRADFASALTSARFLVKIVLMMMLAITAAGLVVHLARPGGIRSGWLYALATVPTLLVLAVLVEMVIVPASQWGFLIMTPNWLVCLGLIPLLAAAPLVAILLALRRGATTHPAMAGAAAGLLSAGIGATLYATHCQSDSPMFVGVWYVIATAVVTLAGALIGDRLLRW